jgi:hypothetical protein
MSTISAPVSSLGRDLRRIDGGRGFLHVHYFPRLQLMGKSRFYIGGDADLHIGLN